MLLCGDLVLGQPQPGKEGRHRPHARRLRVFPAGPCPKLGLTAPVVAEAPHGPVAVPPHLPRLDLGLPLRRCRRLRKGRRAATLEVKRAPQPQAQGQGRESDDRVLIP